MLNSLKLKSGRNLRYLKRRFRYQNWAIIIVAFAIVLGGVWGLRHWYFNSLGPLSSSTTTTYFTVSSGETKDQIAEGLQSAHLIRSAKAMETYLRSSETQILQAGTYKFSPSMSVQQIVHAIVVGDVAKNLLTILPGKRLDQIEQTFAKAGYSQSDINSAFNPATYAGDPALASLPVGASLEGYLYPDSFQKETDTPASAIVKESVDEMGARLTDSIINGFGAQGLTTYQGVTLASIVEQESGNPNDQPTIAQVFILRLKQGMPLQSDVTADYAADIAGQPRSINIDSPYNTYQQPGLPPGPISSMTVSALKAVARPSNTSYLYFIAGDDGKIHFSYTAEQHQQDIQQFCTKSCAQG